MHVFLSVTTTDRSCAFYTFLAGEEEGTLDKTDDFATLLGEEIAASYQKSRSRASTPTVNGISSEKSSPKHNSVNRKLLDNRHMVPVNRTYSHDSSPENLAPTHIKSHVESDRNHPLDTAMVAKTVREILSMHNLGQRLFAKHVLGLSQGTVSELLSKPKSWEKLTEKGRESYRKMYAWASEPRNIMSLKALSPRKGKQHFCAITCIHFININVYYSISTVTSIYIFVLKISANFLEFH